MTMTYVRISPALYFPAIVPRCTMAQCVSACHLERQDIFRTVILSRKTPLSQPFVSVAWPFAVVRLFLLFSPHTLTRPTFNCTEDSFAFSSLRVANHHSAIPPNNQRISRPVHEKHQLAVPCFGWAPFSDTSVLPIVPPNTRTARDPLERGDQIHKHTRHRRCAQYTLTQTHKKYTKNNEVLGMLYRRCTGADEYSSHCNWFSIYKQWCWSTCHRQSTQYRPITLWYVWTCPGLWNERSRRTKSWFRW